MKKRAEELIDAKKTEIAKKVSTSFPDAKLLEIKEDENAWFLRYAFQGERDAK